MFYQKILLVVPFIVFSLMVTMCPLKVAEILHMKLIEDIVDPRENRVDLYID